MPKTNVNTASREQLVEAGLRAELADEILKLRRKGKIAGLEALGELPGVGPATLDQLKKALDFSDQGGNGDDRDQERERGGGAEPGRRAAGQAAEATREATEQGADVARRGLQVVERTVGATAEVEREVARRSAEGTAELGRALVELVEQQTRQNLETLKALSEAVDWGRAAQAVDWNRVLQLQSEYLRTSLERAAQLTQRFLEVSQTVVTAATSVAQREAKKAA